MRDNGSRPPPEAADLRVPGSAASAAASQSGGGLDATGRRLDRDAVVVPLLFAALLGLFALTWNPWWVPTGDSEVYLVIARNVAAGEGLTYRGAAAASVPPGWSLTLGGLIAAGLSVGQIKLCQIAFMTGGLLCGYGVLRRLGLTPGRSAACAGLAGLCSPLYPLTFWLHTDALFVLLAGAATLAAVRWEGRSLWPVVLATTLLCAAISVRWAGAAYAAVVAGALLTNATGGRKWLAAAACVGVAALTTLVLMRGLSGDGLTFISTLPQEANAPDVFVRERPDLSAFGELLHRLGNLPGWFAWGPFVPLRFVVGLGAIGLTLNWLVGGLTAILVTIAAWRQARRGRFVLAGAAAYLLGLCLLWPHVNNRYTVPVLPFLIAGVLVGLDAVRPKPVRATLRALFFAAVVFVNGFMWSVDAWVARSPTAGDFYRRYEAGVHLPLIEVAAELRRRGARDVAASERFENLHERWDYPTSPRVLLYLAGVDATVVPRPMTGWGVRKLQDWARDHDIQYYVHQNPTVPGRVWHFRLTPAEHGATMGDAARLRPDWSPAQFELFEMTEHPEAGEGVRWLDPEPVPALSDAELDAIGRAVARPGGR